MLEDPTSNFFQKKVLNFDIIHHECCGDPLEGSYKDYRMTALKNFQKMIKNRYCLEFFVISREMIYE